MGLAGKVLDVRVLSRGGPWVPHEERRQGGRVCVEVYLSPGAAAKLDALAAVYVYGGKTATIEEAVIALPQPNA